jgi:hypothetical protein
MFLTLAILAGVVAFLTAMQLAPAGMFPPALSYVFGALGLGLTAFAAALKGEDNAIAKGRRMGLDRKLTMPPGAPRGTTVAPDQAPDRVRGMRQPRPHERGFVIVDFRPWLNALAWILAAALITLWVAGCASAWPQACEQDIRGGVSCKCVDRRIDIVAHPTKPRPAGQVLHYCNGQLMPLQDVADELEDHR